MNRIYSLLVVIIIVIFTSCQKEEEVLIPETQPVAIAKPIDVANIQNQLSLIENLSVQTTQDSIEAKSTPKLKSGSEEEVPDDVEIFPLPKEYFTVEGDVAVKYFTYWEVKGLEIKKALTVKQLFNIKNGVVDKNYFQVDFFVGYLFFDSYSLNVGGWISEIKFMLRSTKTNKVFSYVTNNSNIEVPPVDGAQWQLLVSFGGYAPQRYATDLFDYTNKSGVVNVRLEVKSKKVVSIVYITKNLLPKGVSTIQIGRTESNGQYVYKLVDVMNDESTPESIFIEIPFDAEEVAIYGETWGYGYRTHDYLPIVYREDGTIIYNIR